MNPYQFSISSSSSSSTNTEEEEMRTKLENDEKEIYEMINYATQTIIPQLVNSLYPTTRSRGNRRPRPNRERELGHQRLFNDYFSDHPVYHEIFFRRRFRMRREVFTRIMDAVVSNNDWFLQKRDAAGKLGLSPLQKCTAAIRMLAYGVAADAIDEYLRISESTARCALRHFTDGVIAQFGNEYLRKPTPTDLERILQFGDERGFPGMIGSIDCMHWEWKNCPTAWQGQFQGKEGVPTLVLEAVADRDLWIWHSFFGIPGSCNDLNVLYRSHVFDDVLEGRSPPVKFSVNGHHYEKGYYLTDGIYPKWAMFVKSITSPQTPKDRLFAQHQEAARKDVERAFGVLQARFAIIRQPSLAWNMSILKNIMISCIIMHNMIVEDERHRYAHYADATEFTSDQPQGQSSHGNSSNNPSSVQYNTNRGVDINIYLKNKQDVRDQQVHLALKHDLVENIWMNFGPNA